MKHENFERDTAYRVVSGGNDNLRAGDLFWISSKDGSLALAGGWMEKDEIPEDIFDGLRIKRAYEYVTIKFNGGNMQIVHESMILNRWIKVTPDTMPPDMEPVIVSVTHDFGEGIFEKFVRANMRYSQNKGWEYLANSYNNEWWYYANPSEITHWMPTPKPAED